MVFFDDFIKKIEAKESEFSNYSGVRKYGVEIKRKVSLLGTSIPLVLIGIFQAYEGYLKGYKMVYFLMALVFIYLGCRNLKIFFNYRVILDLDKKELLSKDVNINFDEVTECTLKEAIVGKAYQPVLAIITKDKKEIIVPLIMNRKVEFVSIIKNRLKDRFKIINK